MPYSDLKSPLARHLVHYCRTFFSRFHAKVHGAEESVTSFAAALQHLSKTFTVTDETPNGIWGDRFVRGLRKNRFGRSY